MKTPVNIYPERKPLMRTPSEVLENIGNMPDGHAQEEDTDPGDEIDFDHDEQAGQDFATGLGNSFWS